VTTIARIAQSVNTFGSLVEWVVVVAPSGPVVVLFVPKIKSEGA
jgi:hypothetical protein